MNVAAHQEEKMGKRERKEKARENNRLHLKRLCAAFLLLLRGQHDKKMISMR